MSSLSPWPPAYTLFSFGSIILKLMGQMQPKRNLKAYMLSLKNSKPKFYFILPKRKKKIAAIIREQSTFSPEPNLCQIPSSPAASSTWPRSYVTCTSCNDALRYTRKGQCPCVHVHPGNEPGDGYHIIPWDSHGINLAMRSNPPSHPSIAPQAPPPVLPDRAVQSFLTSSQKLPWNPLSLDMKHGLSISMNTSWTYLAKPPHSALKPWGTVGRSTGLSRASPHHLQQGRKSCHLTCLYPETCSASPLSTISFT